MNLELRAVTAGELGLAGAIGGSTGPPVPPCVTALGNPALLRGQKMGLFCSVKCPGDLILRAYDYAKKLRDEGATVIGGFHSPVEKECLRILLRGSQPIIICPARSLENMRIPGGWKQSIEQGRLLLLSPFSGSQKRATAELALERNRFIAAIADSVCFFYATPGGALESLAHDFRAKTKPIVPLP